MRGTIATLIYLALSVSKILSLPTSNDVKRAATIARTLVHRESLLQLNTISQVSDNEIPVSFVEYYADCLSNGNPVLNLIDISSSVRNIENGSPCSVSVRVGDHSLSDHDVNINYPGSVAGSPAGSPRVSLRGHLNQWNATSNKEDQLSDCFLARHPDAQYWLPGHGFHGSRWWQFDVEEVYMIGGFGDRAYIGLIPIEEYRSAELLTEEWLIASQ